MSILHNIFRKLEQEVTVSNSFSEASIIQNKQTLYKERKPLTNITHKLRSENLQQDNSRMNTASNEKIILVTKWRLFWIYKGESTLEKESGQSIY